MIKIDVKDVQPDELVLKREDLLNFAVNNRFFDSIYGTFSDECPFYWSHARDGYLRSYWRKNDILSSIIFTTIAKITSMDIGVHSYDDTITSSINREQDLRHMLKSNSGLSFKFREELSKFLEDVCTTDNGGFMLVLGQPFDLTQPLIGHGVGLFHLDSLHVTRTDNERFPIIYQNPLDGKIVKIHKSRLIMFNDMPSPNKELCGVGFSPLSRAINMVRILVGITNYQLETLGAEPTRQILFGSSQTHFWHQDQKPYK